MKINEIGNYQKLRYRVVLFCMIIFGLVITQCTSPGTTNSVVSSTIIPTGNKVSQPSKEPAWILAIGGDGRDYAPSFY